MTETPRQKQSRFVRLVARLIEHAYSIGYELTFGEAYRTPEQAALNAKSGSGIRASLHCERLAIDLLLFRDGVYLKGSEDYRPLGEFWETLAPDCAWGGRFGDGNHFSIVHNGRR